MPTLTIEYRTDAERQAIEAAIAFVTELNHLAQVAPAGQVLGLCEGHAPPTGRAPRRNPPQRPVQQRIAAAEEKGPLPAAAHAAADSASSGPASGES